MNSQEKNIWRQRRVWKDFRESLRSKRKTDELTGSKLSKKFQLHHMILTNKEEVYTDLSNEDNFMTLNAKSHTCLHWAFDQQVKDPTFLKRFNEAVLKMVQLKEENE